MTDTVTHLDPDGLPRNPAFTQVVVVRGTHRTLYVGGQNGVDATGAVAGDVAAQTRRALANLATALAAGGALLAHVVKWNVYVVDGQPIASAFAAFRDAWDAAAPPPAITLLRVAGLARPDFLVEIDAVAVIPE